MKDTFSMPWMRWKFWLRFYAPLQKCEDLSSVPGDPGSRTRFLFLPQQSIKNTWKQSDLCGLGLCCICTFKVTFQDDFSSLPFFVLWRFHFLIHCLTFSTLVSHRWFLFSVLLNQLLSQFSSPTTISPLRSCSSLANYLCDRLHKVRCVIIAFSKLSVSSFFSCFPKQMLQVWSRSVPSGIIFLFKFLFRCWQSLKGLSCVFCRWVILPELHRAPLTNSYEMAAQSKISVFFGMEDLGGL